ncbi:MAG: NADH-quinone oxidoreductase subunit J, partial [Pseudomonadota bacterium]|nr:NADH-quinone oxidoreductase subunit J [Pseudomonadota bacterium]
MTVADLAFYFFAIVAVVAALLVVVARNPVHSVLWLILTFLSAAGMFVLMGAEFVAMLLVIVYVGAVAVLFLFVVMMLDVDFAELRAGMAKYVPIAGLIGVVILMQLTMVFGSWHMADGAEAARAAVTPDAAEVHNTKALGQLIYDQYIYLFQAAGLILLV